MKEDNERRSPHDEQIQTWIDAYSGTVDIADLLCDRHAGTHDRRAAVCLGAEGEESAHTYRDLARQSKAFASTLQGLGVERGHRVATLLPKGHELLVTTLGIWRLGAIHVPLFTAFGPEAVAYRIGDSATSVVVTDATNVAKLAGMKVDVIVAGVEEPVVGMSFAAAIRREPMQSRVAVRGEETFILIYTSGTTGNPKGVQVPVKALAEIEKYLRFGLGVTEDDVVWNMADPGWAYGLYYALVGSLLLGQCALLRTGAPTAEAVYHTIDAYGVTNLTGAPTVFRLLRAAEPTARTPSRRTLRALSSAGEPLGPDVTAWARARLGAPIHDHYGQTELGMVVVNHHHPHLSRALRPGSIGCSTPGYRTVILDDSHREAEADRAGAIAIDARESPLFWFKGYWNAPDRTAERFSDDGRYYLTGDQGRRDEEGYFYFASRGDDVITSGAYRIGPCEVENSLRGHASVLDVAVVGVPDVIKGEAIKAFVVLKPDLIGTPDLASELQMLVKSRLSAHQYPKHVAFVDELPRTPSGKVQRYRLRQLHESTAVPLTVPRGSHTVKSSDGSVELSGRGSREMSGPARLLGSAERSQ